jgi:glycosyltransferase involved in cell wall biosynthesis
MSDNRVRVAVLISGNPGGALHVRAHSLFGRLSNHYAVVLACHQGSALGRIKHFLEVLHASRPALIYVVDPIYAAVSAAWLYHRVTNVPVMIDTGDLVYELAKEMDTIGPLALTLVQTAERMALKMANVIIVRGTFHQQLLMKQGYKNVELIPDGVDLRQFHPLDREPMRERMHLGDQKFIVGGVGSMIWNARQQTCFGWDLLGALSMLADLPICGVLIGDGNGRAPLKERARTMGLADRMRFVGYMPYHDLPFGINALDICLLTQFNNDGSWVRTTGKLPLYLACDRYVIASAVGEAARLLAPFDMLLPYESTGRDPQYPTRLAEKIRSLHAHPERLQLNGLGVQLAQQHFDYEVLAEQLAVAIEHVMAARLGRS